MPSGWDGSPDDAFVDLVRDGEPVAAAVDGRPISQLARQVQAVRTQNRAAGEPGSLVSRRVAMASDVVVGDTVYFNASTGRLEKALAGLAIDSVTGIASPKPSARPRGLVIAKSTATTGDILIFGSGTIAAASIFETGQSPTTGTLYLSGMEPGKLTATRPAVSIPFLHYDGSGRVFVDAGFSSNPRTVKYAFQLTCLPAGSHTPPAPGGTHSITSPNASLGGWLPAAHASFNGKAPGGAVFGYNLATHAQLRAVWPPLPGGYRLEWIKGVSPDENYGGVPEWLVVVDDNGIWWKSNCYAEAPWPATYDSGAGPPPTPPACPIPYPMKLRITLDRQAYPDDLTVVTKLVSLNERLAVTCSGTDDPAVAGPLDIDLDLTDMVDDDNTLGATVLKGFDGEIFTKGIIVEGIYAASNGVTLISNLATGLLDPEDEESPPVYRGLVGVAIDAQSQIELPPRLIRLDGALEDLIANVPCLTLPYNRITSYVGDLVVPQTLSFATPKLRIRLLLVGQVVGTVPALVLEYFRVATVAVGSQAALGTPSWTATSLGSMPTLSAVNSKFSLTTAALTVAAGDKVVFRLSRAVDAYAGKISVYAQIGTVTGA